MWTIAIALPRGRSVYGRSFVGTASSNLVQDVYIRFLVWLCFV